MSPRHVQPPGASEILSAMEREIAGAGVRLPKLSVMLQKAQREVGATEEAHKEAAEREEQLLQMLVQQMTPDQRLEATGSSARLSGAPSAGRLPARH